MENDLIRRSDVIQALDELLDSPYARQDPFGFAVRDALKLVRDMMNGDVPKSLSIPAVDAVEVVRCRDCRWHEDEQPGMVYCPATVGGWVENDWFCKGGERREDGDT